MEGIEDGFPPAVDRRVVLRQQSSAVALLAQPPVQLTQHGLLALRPLPLHVECAVPLLEQVRWVLGQLQLTRNKRRRGQYDQGLSPPEHSRESVLLALLSVDLPPAPHHRWAGDRLLSAGVVFHCAWNSNRWAATLLGLRGLWTVCVESHMDAPGLDPLPWLDLDVGQPWRDLVGRAYGHMTLGYGDMPDSGQVPPPPVGPPLALHRVWARGDDDVEDDVCAMLGPTDRYAYQDMRAELRNVQLRPWDRGPRATALFGTTGAEGVPLLQLAQTRAQALAAVIGRVEAGPGPTTFQGLLEQWAIRRLCLDWAADGGHCDLSQLAGSGGLHLPTPQRYLSGPGACDDCRGVPDWKVPGLSYQEAWAVAAVYVRSPAQPAPQELPQHPQQLFDELLACAQASDRLTDLAGLRFRHVPSRVGAAGPGARAASLGWAPGSDEVWGPVLGDAVLVHRAPPHLGGDQARCYSLLTVGGLVTLVVRVNHAHLWEEEARQLGWAGLGNDAAAQLAGLWAPALAQGQPPHDLAKVQQQDAQRVDWTAAAPHKVYWWPAARNRQYWQQTAQQPVWGWTPTPHCPVSDLARQAEDLAGLGTAEPPIPAALVYLWTPGRDEERAGPLARLALRQQNLLYLCARVRVEAGRHPSTRLDPSACFYRGCRGQRPAVPLQCVPPQRRALPGQVFNVDVGGAPPSLMLLPGHLLPPTAAAAHHDDPSLPDMPAAQVRHDLYLRVARALALGDVTPAMLAQAHRPRGALFMRALLAEMEAQGGHRQRPLLVAPPPALLPGQTAPRQETPLLRPPPAVAQLPPDQPSTSR